MDDEQRARHDANRELVRAYFAAATQSEIDAAEAAILTNSCGKIEHDRGVSPARSGEAEWCGTMRAEPGGIRSAIFGDDHLDRLTRIAHLELAKPVPHPKGGQTRILPVIGPDQRYPVARDGVLGEPPLDQLYRELASSSRLAELAAGSPIEEYAVSMMTSALARIAAGHETKSWSAWSDAEDVIVPTTPPLQELHDRKQTVTALRLFDDTCLVAYPSALVLARLRDGKILRAIDTANATFVAAPTDRYALLSAEIPVGPTFDATEIVMQATEDALGRAGIPYDPQAYDFSGHEHAQSMGSYLFALDLANGRWIAPPDDAPRVRFEEGMEQSHLVDNRGRSIRLRDVADYPVITAFTPDHLLVWVEDKEGSGGVYRTRDGALVTMRNVDVMDDLDGLPRLTRKETLARATEDWCADKQEGSAFVRTPRGRMLSFGQGIVAENWRPYLAIDGASTVAAFDLHGRHLATSDGKTVRVIDVAAPEPHTIASWSLAACKARATEVIKKRASARTRSAG